jgi:hypothetical protein
MLLNNTDLTTLKDFCCHSKKVQKEISMLGDVNGQPPANTSTGNQQFNII